MAWIKNNESTNCDKKEQYVQYYSNEWFCTDGDSAMLTITYLLSTTESPKYDNFELSCFSGIQASFIVIDSFDFPCFNHLEFTLDMTDEEMIFKIADYLCEKFCEKRC